MLTLYLARCSSRFQQQSNVQSRTSTKKMIHLPLLYQDSLSLCPFSFAMRKPHWKSFISGPTPSFCHSDLLCVTKDCLRLWETSTQTSQTHDVPLKHTGYRNIKRPYTSTHTSGEGVSCRYVFGNPRHTEPQEARIRIRWYPDWKHNYESNNMLFGWDSRNAGKQKIHVRNAMHVMENLRESKGTCFFWPENNNCVWHL